MKRSGLIIMLLFLVPMHLSWGQDPVLVGASRDESITSIRSTAEGKICYSSLRGLFSFDGTEVTEIIGNANVLDFLPEDDGSFWIAAPSFVGHWTSGEGITMYQQSLYGDKKSLCEVSDSTLVFTNDSGIYLMDKRNGEAVSSFQFSFPVNAVLYVTQEPERIVVCSGNTVMVFDTALSLLHRAALPVSSPVNGIAEISDGEVILGSGTSLMSLKMEDFSLRNFASLSSSLLSVIPLGEERILCFTSDREVEAVFPDGTHQRVASLDVVPSGPIRSFALDDSHVWFSVPRKGLYGLVLPHNDRPRNLDSLVRFAEGKRLQGICEDTEGRIWILEGGTLSVFDKNEGSIISVNTPGEMEREQIRAFTITSDNKVWLSTNDYLGRFSIKGNSLVPDIVRKFEGNMVFRIVEDVDGVINFASYYNQYKYSDKSSFMVGDGNLPMPVAGDASHGFYLEYLSDRVSFRTGGTMRERLPILNQGAIVIDALLSSGGDVWCLTSEGRILRIGQENGSVSTFFLPEWSSDVPLDYFKYPFYSIEEDEDGMLWVGSAYGLVRLDPSDGDMTFFNSSNKYDYYTTSFKDSEGFLYFAYSNGLSVFSARSTESLFSTRNIPFQIDHLLVNDVLYSGDMNSPALLDFNENSLAFKCIDINYDNLSVRYSYTLEGFEKEWHPLKQRYVSYPGLPHGSYVFKLKAEGGLEQMTKSFSFTIRQKPWLRWWALLSYFIVLSGILSLILVWIRRRREAFAAREKLRIQSEIDKAKIDLFTNLSHEIRTPLSLIVAPLSDLEHSSSMDPADRKKVEMMSRNARELLDITNQVLGNDLSSNTPLDVRRHDIHNQIRKSVDLFTPLALQKKQTILVDSEHIAFGFDSSKFSRIMSNLISNAIKYSDDPGEIVISTAILGKDEAKSIYGKTFNCDMVEVKVCDNGPGIPEGENESIFERHTRKVSGGIDVQGFGIGLNYVRELVSLHDGAIKAENVPEGGAMFRFVLPVRDGSYELLENVHDAPIVNQEDDSSIETSVDFSKCSLLVVEDNEDMNLYLSDLFSHCGKVLSARDGLSALEILRNEYVDLVVSDVMMEGMDGFELCHTIKEDSDLCSVSVVLLTAKTDVGSQIRGFNTGADAYVVKPFIPDYLMAVVGSIIKNREKMQMRVQKETSESLSDGEAANPDMNPLDKIFLEKLYKALDERLREEDINVNVLHQELGMSRTSFYMKVKSLTGMSPIQFINEYRMNKAVALLKSQMYSIKEIAYMLGYQTRQSFTARFKSTFGVSPTQYLGDKDGAEEEED